VVQQQRIPGVPAEPDVHDPALVERNHQCQVVERHAELTVANEHPRRVAAHREPQLLEQQGKGAVELVAEPAAPAADDLVEQCVLVEADRLAEVDAQVLERHRPQVPHVQLAQQFGVRFADVLGCQADPGQVRAGDVVIHDNNYALSGQR